MRINWSKIVSGGNRLPLGHHKCEITLVDDDVTAKSGTKGWEVTFVGAGGRNITDTFWLTEKAFGRLKQLAESCGIKLEGEMDLTPDMLVGKSCWLTVEATTYQAGDGSVKQGAQVSPYSYSEHAPTVGTTDADDERTVRRPAPAATPRKADERPAQGGAAPRHQPSLDNEGKLKDYGFDNSVPF